MAADKPWDLNSKVAGQRSPFLDHLLHRKYTEENDPVSQSCRFRLETREGIRRNKQKIRVNQ